MIISTSKASYHNKISVDVAAALVATDYKDPPIISLNRQTDRQTVRRAA